MVFLIELLFFGSFRFRLVPLYDSLLKRYEMEVKLNRNQTKKMNKLQVSPHPAFKTGENLFGNGYVRVVRVPFFMLHKFP